MIQFVFEAKRPLASRRAAARAREILESYLATTEDKLQIDMSAVDEISSLYADELFGVLAEQLSLDVFSSRVQVVGANAHVRREIVSVIAKRIDRATHDSKAAAEAAEQILDNGSKAA
jgi:anti-anti-sigma regulatory factor